MTASLEKVASAIGSVARLQIIGLLDEYQLSVGQIAKDLNISSSAVSQHLAKLREADLVFPTKDGHKVYYNLADNGVADFMAQMVNEINQQS